ncbi:MAG: hypothetical protein J0M08_04435 [Bacteroidetes bacterium]|nr:hypothetical protein [Bacteroidota bacterium]
MDVRKLLVFFLFISTITYSQTNSTKKSKNIFFSSDTLQLDSLSIIPGSFYITGKNGKLDSALYKVNYAEAKLILLKKKNIPSDTFNVYYKTFPINFSKPYYHKTLDNYVIKRAESRNPFSFETTSPENGNDIFKNDGLSKNGSIARGISFGNNQDVVVNSSLNLQVSGKLTENIDIALAATDNNIPIQPDGSTQQLQDFDRVYMQLSDKTSKLIVGDFPMSRPNSYFLNFNKKAQGLNFSNKTNLGTEQKKINNTITATGAVSRGKFSRFKLQGIESNQGPYRLQGAENEPFIIVLSGTENVYIDGELLKRGQENDYIVDYNTAEITFTAKRQITKDKRIVVEFQYADKNYARSLFYLGDELEFSKTKIGIHFFSEQDNKNQPLQQELSSNEKLLLSQIGDTLSKAITSGIDSAAFNNSEVFYEKKDSVIGSQLFNAVYVYSTNSEKAKYRLTFSFVGAGNGNYEQIQSSANGRVFRWIMPDTITGLRRGSFEPIIPLITPKQKQFLVSTFDHKLTTGGSIAIEGALSKNDINTFSSINSNDDWGKALKISYKGTFQKASIDSANSFKHWLFKPLLSYEYTEKTFTPIERYRPVEFERDWNRLSITASNYEQHWITTGIEATKKNVLANYTFNSFFNGPDYRGIKQDFLFKESNHFVQTSVSANKLDVSAKNPSAFIRTIGYATGKSKYANIGVRGLFEKSESFKSTLKDTLLANSFYFYEVEPYIQSPDTSKRSFELAYKQRWDYYARNTAFTKSTFAEVFSGKFVFIKSVNHNLSGISTLRKLSILDTTTTAIKPDNTLTTRIEHNARIKKGFFTTATFYEIGSGLELQREFSYLEVAPGQGNYSWIDYNSNGIKELNEFEIAVFNDQAKYIKVFTPTNKYVRTYQQQFSQSVNIMPAAIWSSKKGMKKFIALFSNQTIYRIDKKTATKNTLLAYNPFVDADKDSSLLTTNSLLRNTTFFNQTNPTWGIDITYQDVRNQTLLTNGTEWRSTSSTDTRIRWNFTNKFTLIVVNKTGTKTTNSEFFSNRNYHINVAETSPQLSFQPNTNFRITASYKYSAKKNAKDLGNQQVLLQDIGLDARYNILSKASLSGKFNYIFISYNDLENTPISFEMLEGLRIGENTTWGLSYQQNVSNNVQVNILYDGRKTQGNKPIHTGNVQVRAFF